MTPDEQAEHELVCLSCWMRAVGVPEQVGFALIGATFVAGRVAAIREVMPPSIAAGYLTAGAVVVMPADTVSILQMARQLISVPASPDVAAAMRGGH